MSWKGRRKLVEELAMVLVKVRALQFGTFTLSSGRLSSYYVDLRAVPSYPGAYGYVIDAYEQLIKNEVKLKGFDAIAGIPTAGLAFSSPVALRLKKPMIYVRKDAKEYGRGRRIEGTISPGWKVLVVDDLITTGRSIISAAEAIKEEGCEVVDVAVLIDRLEGGAASLKKAGMRLRSLTDIREMTEILASKDVLEADELKAIRTQLRSPRGSTG